MAITRQVLVEHLENEFGLNPAEIDDDTPLFSSGLLDSYSVAELVIFIEEQGGFVIEPTEIKLEHLDSINNIQAFIEQKIT